MTGNVKIVAVLTARSGRNEDLRLLLSGLIDPSRAEPGNLRYDLWQDPREAGRYLLDELYVDRAAAAAHRASPHFQAYLARINDLAERTAWTLDALAVSG